MSDVAYAVHTRTCIYLLDEEGICRWTLAPTGVPAPGADRCVGAQFVACLDVRVEGGLVGELMIGASALFARVERGRFVLLRTPIIEYVEFRSGDEVAAEPSAAALQAARDAIVNPPTDPLPDHAPYADHRMPSAPSLPDRGSYADHRAPSASRQPSRAWHADHRMPSAPGEQPRAASAPRAPYPPPPARAPSSEELDMEEIVDVEELHTFSEVTLTIPLYRPDAQAAPPDPPRRGGVIGRDEGTRGSGSLATPSGRGPRSR